MKGVKSAGRSDGRPESAARVRQILERVYGVDGVVSARVWIWDGHVAVGVRGAAQRALPELLKRVEAATQTQRADDETWEFGALDGA